MCLCRKFWLDQNLKHGFSHVVLGCLANQYGNLSPPQDWKWQFGVISNKKNILHQNPSKMQANFESHHVSCQGVPQLDYDHQLLFLPIKLVLVSLYHTPGKVVLKWVILSWFSIIRMDNLLVGINIAIKKIQI